MQRSLLVLCSAVSGLMAQDTIAVNFLGEVHAVNTYNATSVHVATLPINGNAMARGADGTIFIGSPLGVSTYAPHTHTLSPVAGTGGLDVRGLAHDGGQLLYIVANGGGVEVNDVLWRRDLVAQTTVNVGTFASPRIQALSWHGGQLYGWDIGMGLVLVNPNNAQMQVIGPWFTPRPAVQFLMSRSDGKLIGGGEELREFDPLTGNSTLIGTGLTDIRGAEEWYAHWRPFGTACNASFGPMTLIASGNPRSGSTFFRTISQNHAFGAVGMLLIGLSDTSYLGRPLPHHLDPWYGTVGCNLHVSIDYTLPIYVGNQTLPSTLTTWIPIPPGLGGMVFYVQHASMENVPGGLALSNALAVRVGY